MSSTIRISLAQITSGENPADNLELIDTHARAAAHAGSDLVVFPEATMRCFGGPIRKVAQPLDGEWAHAVREIAATNGITVVAGMFTPAADDRVANTLLVTGTGIDASYDKIHLFDAFGFAESDTVAPGSDPLVVGIAGVQVGFATCYDIRFPALFQKLGDLGADVIVVPASWGAGDGKVEQWTLLARARALDSTTFIAACDQAEPVAAEGNAPRGVGHSIVSSPTGEILGQLDSTPGMLTIDIDTALVDAVRKSLPVLKNRKHFDA
ncbi:putative hydrolase [Rhodococcus sp. AW25M09]|uniref:carbon-nitrogen hydrolase family protein n=1 Tax=Rhodococcus sp. AW25M09 TaxID=1268303 RepID=UPI0002ABF88D|nr:carbon-nitrogen hydrolase family protein [Rhodococcus sp. AW25M09]CCQ17727.1 putative hydrolase [Rhodococcus sp. AW25M09]